MTSLEPEPTSNDITEELEKLRQELVEARKTIEKLKQSKDDLADFAACVLNYDVGTPLRLITGYAELLLQDESSLTTESQNFVSVIQKKAREIHQVRTNAIEILRSEQTLNKDSLWVNAEKIDLLKIISDSELQQQEDVNIIIQSENSPKVPGEFQGVSYTLRNVVRVLSNNHSKGTVTVNIDTDANWIVVNIKNSEVILSNLTLESFNRIAKEGSLLIYNSAHDEIRLSIDRYFIETSGGEMELVCDSEAGSVVTIKLPIAKDT